MIFPAGCLAMGGIRCAPMNRDAAATSARACPKLKQADQSMIPLRTIPKGRADAVVKSPALPLCSTLRAQHARALIQSSRRMLRAMGRLAGASKSET